MVSYYRSGSEFTVNSFATDNQTAPTISRFSDGGFVISWGTLDSAQDGDSSAIKAQLFDANGEKVGAELLVNSSVVGSQFTPSIATLGNDTFIVTWVTTDSSQDGSGNAIKAQLFSRSGSPIGTEFLVNTQTGSSQVTPNVTQLANGGFVISWDDWSSFDTKAQIFDANGARVGGEFRLNTSTNAAQEYGDIVGLANGGFVATWRTTDALADGSDQAVKAQIFDTSGAKLGAEFLVNSQTNGSQYDPNIAALANGGFVVTWYTTDAAQDGNGGAIKGQMFSASGARIGGEFLVNTQSANTQREPFATGLPDGGFMVTWSTLDTMQDGSGSAIKAQVFDASGVKIGGELLVNTLAAGGQFLPDIATLADGRVVVTWTSDNGDGSGFALRARILAPNTAPDITSDGGDASASVAADENQTAVTSVAATDLGGPSPVTYAISGGADAALFAIDPVTGALRFVTERDFENAADANGDGVYDVIVSAGDGELTSTQALSVSIVNVNEGLTITSGAAVSIGENGTAVSTVTASDIDGDAPSFAIGGGADAGFFAIDAGTGAISFVNAPNFEAPGDADGDNVYDVIVSATDGDFVTTQAIAISVGNVDEAVTITSDGGGDGAALSIAENGTAVTTVTAIDVDGSLVSYAVTGGGDAALFTIDAQTGALSFLTSPDFEAPADADGNNVYDVIVSATDGTFSDAQALAVTVTNAREGNTIIGTSGSNIISTTNSPTGQPRATELEDTIYGLGGGDTIRAAGGDDIIDGGSGNDMITGGTGADIITGGTGADRFIYNSVSESSAGAVDIIADFSRSQGDRISLSPIDANSGAWGNQGFNFIGTAAFSGVAGQLRYEQANGNTFVAGDVDGDGVADLQIQLNGLIDLRSTDFLL